VRVRSEALAVAGHVCDDATPHMKANTLPWATALTVAVAWSIAPSVYSQGATNSINVTVPPRSFVLVGNPLNRGSNTLSEILPDVPIITTVLLDFIPVPTAFLVYRKHASGWAPPGSGAVLGPGKGFFIQNTATSATTLTFVGDIPKGTNTINIVPGYNLLAPHFPVAGKVETDLGLPALNGDKVLKFDAASQNYVLYTRRATEWSPAEPEMGVAEGFFFETTNSVSWTRTFNPPRP
jgi:hypothetical protein